MLKAISLLQPWATLVVTGAKRVETRSWTTAYRGTLMIHASKGRSGAAVAQLPRLLRYIPDFNVLPFGAIIGEARLTDVIRIESLNLPREVLEDLTLEEHAFGNHRAGRYAWLLTDAVVYDEPITARGAPGLWNAG